MNIPVIILIAAATTATPASEPLSIAMTKAKAEMGLAVSAMDRAGPALQVHDMQTACPLVQQAHDHFAAARDIFEEARVWYLKNEPQIKEAPQYLAEDRDSMTGEMDKLDFILVTGCGGIKPPAKSQ